MKRLAFGVHLPVRGFGGDEPSREDVLSSAKKAEKLGFDSASVNERIATGKGWLDSLTVLAAATAATSRIKLSTSVLNIVVRNPVISAHALSTIDILSSGRLLAGVGPGSDKNDYDAAGIPFEQRWGRFREGLEILTGFWMGDRTDYIGRFYRLEDLSLLTRPLQKPHPPVLVGSWGSKAVLRMTGRIADGWMASAYNITPERLAESRKIIDGERKRCGRDGLPFEVSVMTMFGYIADDEEKVHALARDVLSPSLGRSPEALEKQLLFGNPSQCILKLKRLRDAGADRIHFWPISDYEEQIETFAREVAPAFS